MRIVSGNVSGNARVRPSCELLQSSDSQRGACPLTMTASLTQLLLLLHRNKSEGIDAAGTTQGVAALSFDFLSL